jgi:hypothetical protein
MADASRATGTRSSSRSGQEQGEIYYGRGADRGAAYVGYDRGENRLSSDRERAFRSWHGYGDERRWTEMADTRTVGALALGALLGLAGTLLFNAQPSRLAWRGSSDRAWPRRRATRSTFVEHDETTELIYPAGESGFSDPEFGRRVTDYWSAAGSTASLI